MADIHSFDLKSFDADVEARADRGGSGRGQALKDERAALVEEARAGGFETGRREGSAGGLRGLCARGRDRPWDQLKAAAVAVREKRGLSPSGDATSSGLRHRREDRAQIALGKPSVAGRTCGAPWAHGPPPRG
jgi:hypothetical protein